MALVPAFLCLVAAASAASTPRLCPSQLFPDLPHPPPLRPLSGGGVCGTEPSCCTKEMEGQLKTTVVQDLHELLYRNFRSVQKMLASTATSLAGEVERLSNQSEANVLQMFSSVYKNMVTRATSPTQELYSSLANYLHAGLRLPTDLPQAIPSDDSSLLRNIVFRFFERLFPLVYQKTIHYLSGNSSTISSEYAECLSNSTSYIRPFGLYPEELSGKVAKSFETTKVLLEALSLGVEVLNFTDHLMSAAPEHTESCREALLRLYYCPRCLGLPSPIKPCNGYCLNVLRGCLTQQRTTELDLPWSNFLLEVENLIHHLNETSSKLNTIDQVLLNFNATISEAIMYATMNGPDLEKKVKLRCGPPKLVSAEAKDTIDEAVDVGKTDKNELSKMDPLLNGLLSEVEAADARGLFANLAEALCSDETFAETRDTSYCWNGHRVGEYTKALVKPGIDAQRYNPELKWTETIPDPSIRHLSDKLRHMRQVVLGRYKMDRWDLVSDSLTVQSGSGGSGDDNFDEDIDDREGSGSGDGNDQDFHPKGPYPHPKEETGDAMHSGDNTIQTEKPKGSAFSISSSLTIVLVFITSIHLLQ